MKTSENFSYITKVKNLAIRPLLTCLAGVLDLCHGGGAAEVLKSEGGQIGISCGGRGDDVDGRLSAAVTILS